MKIVFLCGSLEPGKDGVGDYTRRLATELQKKGIDSTLIALNDSYVESAISALQTDASGSVKTLRMPSDLSWMKKSPILKKVLIEEQPDWVSLQYVPFAFQPKGLPFTLTKFLKSLGVARWHIMFHELWYGMEDTLNLKGRVYEILQSFIIFKMIASLRPKIIHTQTKLYQAQIAKRNYKAHLLPLFGNIPVTRSKPFERKNQIAVFGSIHAGADINGFLSLYKQFKHFFVPSLKLLFIGRNGSERDIWIRLCEESAVSTEILGELDVDQVSECLQTSIAGISTTPLLLADKSGVVAALKEHGLPVIDLGRPWKARGVDDILPPKGLLSPLEFFKRASLHSSVESQEKLGVEYTTQLFIQDLHLDTH